MHKVTVQGNVISTPAPSGTILEGITRKSIIDIACDLGYLVNAYSLRSKIREIYFHF